MEKVFGVVILYNPASDVIQNIRSYAKKLSKLYIFDNSDAVVPLDLKELGSNIVYTADGINKGIAERLNQAAAQAMAEEGDWLLTMDQDSFFDEQALDIYFSCITSSKEKEQVAMFGLEYEQKTGALNCESEETSFLITSGSLVNLELFKKIGGFDERLFIDEVDSEYCLRANINGYKTVKFKNIF
ncbi:glycosyltransferase family protein [Niabella ginsengisoli]|uniref:Glycosyltransferase n=1 Tax=Niabella ginsengisoli TaxID=522298 RepID=A0ABS9SEP7_9BACT|nr:hypothetical protein [Niabella ginsengisoli]MCH5596835.1 hypothetical protein [Niabella ginsengisoli]